MGNTPSSNTKPSNSAVASPSPSHESSRTPASSSRRDHPRNLIQSQRTGATAEPSLAQARGTTATHRPRGSQSIPVAHLNHPSPIQSIGSPAQSINPQQSTAQSKEGKVDVQELPSKPVDVPAPASNIESSSLRSHSQSIEPSGPPATQDMSYQYTTRPPRLPLPIEEEVHTPGSPIITPSDVNAPVLDLDTLEESALPRRSSALSSTTVDEEDADELNVDTTKATVPTAFEWKRGGEKVYVTGTIFQWNKKHRLHPVEGQPGLLRAIIAVRPGTHHIRFIVDTLMQCSPDLPTTVDFGNNLVNYIEVSADDIPQEAPPPTVAAGAGLPATDAATKDETTGKESKAAEEQATKPSAKTKPVINLNRYSSQIPQYLVDLDKPEDSREYQHVAAAIEKLPTPPSLPGFLGKPILNAATPMKDDNSVLIMPNHTVLNHLATSSIKQNVLAVSGTTRYKKKYVTTIMYKPTADD